MKEWKQLQLSVITFEEQDVVTSSVYHEWSEDWSQGESNSSDYIFG